MRLFALRSRPSSLGRCRSFVLRGQEEQFELFFKADAHNYCGIWLDYIGRYLYNPMIKKSLKESRGFGQGLSYTVGLNTSNCGYA
ncbi:hypothetical protein MGMO_9c00060 [Methyloglobulus morosus KoM1]|uniref:Uncharacterized protein n=1 Tax=Methyloglobulus morosus KoM1 TaxID=1116472 RepID=V5BKF9_9GAMM|nr:hypothetical protein MGMO_9c00060 [Methyloglobulus morosus KoM1]